MTSLKLLIRRPNPVAGLAVQTLTVVVNRGDKRLGVMLDDSNVVLEVKPNSPAAGLILPGDQARLERKPGARLLALATGRAATAIVCSTPCVSDTGRDSLERPALTRFAQ